MSNEMTVSLKVQDITTKTPKEKPDGMIDVITTLNNTLHLFRFSKEQYEQIEKRKHLPKRSMLVTGEGKIVVSTKTNKPCMFVQVEDVHSLKTKKPKSTILQIKQTKFNESANRKNKKVEKNWYDEIDKSELIEIDPNEVDLYEKVHVNANCCLQFNKYNKYKYISPIAIRKVNDRYVLVSGFNRYIFAKVFNKKLTAIVTDLDKKEFDKKYDTTITK